MRIAFVVHDARPGGGQDRYALELVNRMARDRGHDVTLVSRSASGLDPSVVHRRVVTPNRPPQLRALAFRRAAARILDSASWDVVHTIGGAYPGASVITAQYCQAAWREARARWPDGFTGMMERVYRDAVARDAIRRERQAAGDPHLVKLIAVSRRTLGEWRTHYDLGPVRTKVIPNAVDGVRFRPAGRDERVRARRALDLPADQPVALTVGALVRKGIETAVEVVAGLPGHHLLAVGAGPTRKIRRLARKMGVRDRLHLRPPVADIARVFHAADYFLFPTRYEPFGMVILEAWASGVPVITCRLAGAVEWAEHERNVLLVDDPSDVSGFAAMALRLAGDPDLCQALAGEGRKLSADFTWERVAGETESLYGE